MHNTDITNLDPIQCAVIGHGCSLGAPKLHPTPPHTHQLDGYPYKCACTHSLCLYSPTVMQASSQHIEAASRLQERNTQLQSDLSQLQVREG
jgi:hypothetical protein